MRQEKNIWRWVGLGSWKVLSRSFCASTRRSALQYISACIRDLTSVLLRLETPGSWSSRQLRSKQEKGFVKESRNVTSLPCRCRNHSPDCKINMPFVGSPTIGQWLHTFLHMFLCLWSAAHGPLLRPPEAGWLEIEGFGCAWDWIWRTKPCRCLHFQTPST